MKKVLILSCSTGQGHNSCAQAVKEYFEKQKVDCAIQDSLNFISKAFSNFLSRGHSFIYRYLPGLFRWGYGQSENHPAVLKETSLIYKLLTRRTDRMYHYIKAEGFDTVICTHIFSAMMLTQMLKEYPLHIETAFIATDYTCHPGMNSSDLGKYFIPDELLVGDFVNMGLEKKRIVATGIPVRESFHKHVEKSDAKRLLNIRSNSKHLLVMSGSMGCGPIARMLKIISQKMNKNMEVTVICGTNKRLFRKLNRRYRNNFDIHIVGYTKQMSLYMDSADLYLTKPGGISVTEAAVKKLPMLFVNAVAGCEEYNMNYFEERGAAASDPSPKELASRSINLLESLELKHMENALKKHIMCDGAKSIYNNLNERGLNEQSRNG